MARGTPSSSVAATITWPPRLAGAISIVPSWRRADRKPSSSDSLSVDSTVTHVKNDLEKINALPFDNDEED